MSPSVLLIDEDSPTTRALLDELRVFLPDLDVATASSTFRAVHHLRGSPAACVIVAHPLPNDSAFRCVEKLRCDDRRLVIVAMSATPSVQQAVRFIRLGADDYTVRSPHAARTIAGKIRWLLERRSVALAEQMRAHARGTREADPGVVDRLPLPARLRQAIGTFASSARPVLIGGGSAAMRRRVAWALHVAGGRAAEPFAVVRCSMLDEAAFALHVEARLRGSRASSASECDAARTPVGSVLLEEVERLARPLQARLATLLSSASDAPFGASSDAPTAMRVIAGSDRPLRETRDPTMLGAELLHRLAVLTLSLPPPRRERDTTRRIHDLLRRLAMADPQRAWRGLLRS